MIDLTWQHQIVAVELIASAVWGTVLIAEGGYTSNPLKGILWAISDAIMIVLLIAGATTFNWQIGGLVGYYMVACLTSVTRGLQHKRYVFPPDQAIAGAVTAAIMAFIPLMILVTA